MLVYLREDEGGLAGRVRANGCLMGAGVGGHAGLYAVLEVGRTLPFSSDILRKR
jgi:hypothetical protein